MSDKSKIEWCDATVRKPAWKYKGDRHASFIEIGKRRCSNCRGTKILDEFDVDMSRPLGRAYVCKECKNRDARNKHIKKPKPSRYGPLPKKPIDGDKKQARHRVNVMVRTGKFPHPNSLPCVDCGHIWRDGERRHEYDHYLGYEGCHHLDFKRFVQSVIAGGKLNVGKTKIEWATDVWNPVTGCTKVSEGCRNCYAMKFAERFRGTPGHYFENGFDITLRTNKLLDPIKWRKPKKIFVNSMSDLFHKDIPDWYIDQVFGVMLANHVIDWQAAHIFQLLTKRPERMQEYLGIGRDELLKRWSESLDGVVIMDNPDVLFSEYVSGFLDQDDFFPLPNLWAGVSVENQKAADERIPLLLQTPVAVRFLSCEPLLGPVTIPDVFLQKLDWGEGPKEWPDGAGTIDWIIVGGESGPGARPMHPDWARSIRDQCQAAGVAFHFKQWGEWLPNAQEYGADPGDFDYNRKHVLVGEDEIPMCKAGKKAAGRLLDGRTWDEFPEVVR